MIDKVLTSECVTCGNCSLICPAAAITMTNRIKSFNYPQINKDKCVKCNKCEQVCPALYKIEQKDVLKVYAARHRDLSIRKSSSSGGIFTALVSTILDEDNSSSGRVYGAVMGSDFTVKHIGVDTLSATEPMRGSKYVQSKLEGTFVDITNDLKEGRNVLFTGCPCQCAALTSWLGERTFPGNLFMMDFVCHGILSDELFSEYISSLEKKYHKKIASFSFRDKMHGWIRSGPKITFSDGTTTSWYLSDDVYMQGYFQGICMRESCYNCKYKNFMSGSNLTIGDFWGAEVSKPDIFDDTGLSLLCVLDSKGEQLTSKMISNGLIDYELSDLKTAVKYNRGLVAPFSKGPLSEKYYRLSNNSDSFKVLYQLTHRKVYINRLIHFIKRWLGH